MNAKASLLAHTQDNILYDCLKDRIRDWTLIVRDTNKTFVTKIFFDAMML